MTSRALSGNSLSIQSEDSIQLLRISFRLLKKNYFRFVSSQNCPSSSSDPSGQQLERETKVKTNGPERLPTQPPDGTADTRCHWPLETPWSVLPVDSELTFAKVEFFF